MKTLSGIDSRVIGLKLAGSSVPPFLCINMVQAFFHSDGTTPHDQATWIISVKYERRLGQRLKQMIDIWSSGHGEPDGFILRMTFVIS